MVRIKDRGLAVCCPCLGLEFGMKTSVMRVDENHEIHTSYKVGEPLSNLTPKIKVEDNKKYNHTRVCTYVHALRNSVLKPIYLYIPLEWSSLHLLLGPVPAVKYAYLTDNQVNGISNDANKTIWYFQKMHQLARKVIPIHKDCIQLTN